MGFQRDLWTRRFSKTTAPLWPCPSCRKGTLHLKKETLVSHEMVSSQREREEDYWDIHLYRAVFSVWLKCSIHSCQQDVIVTGFGGVEEYYVPGDEFADDSVVHDEFYTPTFMLPMSDMIDIPEKCPDEIARQLRASFELFWCDKSAAAGRVRVALELIMDHLHIKRRQKQASGKIMDLSLHRRIDIFNAKDSRVGEQLMALKWLGNAGSHETVVSEKDLLDAFEILDHVLVEIFEQRSKKIKLLARQLTKRYSRKKR